MEKQRGTTVAIVAALIIAVISLGVAFAAFSTTLNINGTATVQASSWDVYFATAATGTDTKPSSSTALTTDQIQETNRQSGIQETVTDATGSIVATTFTWSAKFKTPGDQVRYTLYIKNGGTYNAKITNVSLPTPTCKISGTQTAETTICGKIKYTLTNAGDGSAVANNQTLAAGETKTFYLTAYLEEDGWIGGTNPGDNPIALPTNTIVTDTISATVTYTQAQ